MSEHTPTPWFAASAYSSVCGVPIVSQKGGRVGNTALPDMPKEWDELKKRAVADAAFICEAVNNHARLTEQVEAGAAEIAWLTAALARAREALFSPEESDASENLDGTLEALTALVEHGITSDVQQLLVLGSKAQGVPPGALSKAVKAALLAAQSAAPKKTGDCDLASLWEAIIDNTQGNGFWLREILLSTIARETGFNESAQSAAPVGEPMDFFTKNVDAWSAAEWFDRLARAVRQQDASVLAGDEMAMEICRNVAASSAMRLVRDYEQQVRAALAALPANPGNTEP